MAFLVLSQDDGSHERHEITLTCRRGASPLPTKVRRHALLDSAECAACLRRSSDSVTQL